MFRYRMKIVLLSAGVLFGYASAYRHLTHGHSHGEPWHAGAEPCWHWPGAEPTHGLDRGAPPQGGSATPGAGAAPRQQVQ
jgi:hypothetical protein